MSRRAVVVGALVALGATVLGPALALAGSPQGRGGGGGGMQGGARQHSVRGSAPFTFTGKPFTPPNIPKHFGTPHSSSHGFFSKPFHRPFGGFGGGAFVSAPCCWGGGGYASSSVFYYPPPAYYQSPIVYAAPAVSTVAVAPPAPPPPMDTVVEYAHGRYELRGDGVYTPYSWVWIPAPPSAPPPPPGGAAPAASTGPRELYRWTDSDGVLHVTDRLASVPERYRAAAKEAAQQ